MRYLFDIGRMSIRLDAHYRRFVWEIEGYDPLSKTDIMIIYTINLLNKKI